ncbi:MAG: amidohydrolase family protein, partial [Planctomycetota bacterium]
NKAWLDPISADNPVFLSRMDGHQALVNSAALKLAGIDAQGPPDSVGGEIERDPKTREPTGILKESNMDLLDRFIPDPTRAERREALLRAMKHANSFGVTSVHDMSQLADLDVFRQASEQNTLTVRITTYLNVEDWSARFTDAVQAKELWTAPMFRLAGFKGFMDGSLGSRTAYMREPYTDATPTTLHPRGQLTAFASSQTFQQQVTQADAKELQMAVHAIGDEGIHLLLDAYEAAAKQNGTADRRHRVEHAQHLLVSNIPHFAKLGVVASMQPFHKADDGRYAEKAIGAERLKGSYAFRQLVDAGALVVFGSDWPVVTLNPFAGIDAAVNAKTLSGEVWLPSHSLTVDEAMRAYTVSPPKAIHQESRLGTLEPGKLADFVILVDDPLTMPRERLAEVKVAQTIVGGKVVYP